MTLSDFERLSKISNDTQRRAACLRLLSFLLFLLLMYFNNFENLSVNSTVFTAAYSTLNFRRQQQLSQAVNKAQLSQRSRATTLHVI